MRSIICPSFIDKGPTALSTGEAERLSPIWGKTPSASQKEAAGVAARRLQGK
jgi:hypothetical protein